MKRLRGQTLRYFDDVLEYTIAPCHGSAFQQERNAVLQKAAQRVQFVEDVIAGVIETPPLRAKVKAELTDEDRALLSSLYLVDQDLLWDLLMQDPSQQIAFAAFIERKGLWRRLRRFAKTRSEN